MRTWLGYVAVVDPRRRRLPLPPAPLFPSSPVGIWLSKSKGWLSSKPPTTFATRSHDEHPPLTRAPPWTTSPRCSATASATARSSPTASPRRRACFTSRATTASRAIARRTNCSRPRPRTRRPRRRRVASRMRRRRRRRCRRRRPRVVARRRHRATVPAHVARPRVPARRRRRWNFPAGLRPRRDVVDGAREVSKRRAARPRLLRRARAGREQRRVGDARLPRAMGRGERPRRRRGARELGRFSRRTRRAPQTTMETRGRGGDETTQEPGRIRPPRQRTHTPEHDGALRRRARRVRGGESRRTRRLRRRRQVMRLFLVAHGQLFD